MGYLQKEKQILQRLADTDYETFHGDKDKALNFMTKKLGVFPEYMGIVVRMETMQPIWRAQFEGQEYRERVQSIDTERKRTHDSAIASVNALNRLSDKLGLPPFSKVDTGDRHAVADMISEYVSEIYKTGTNKDYGHDVQAHMKELQQAGQLETNSLELE